MKPVQILSALIPIILLGLALYVFMVQGPPGVFSAAFPPVEELAFERVVLAEDSIVLHVLNDGPEKITIAQILINDAYWKFSIEPDSNLEPRERSAIALSYPWIFGEEVHIAVLSGSGLLFEHVIPVATTTPTFSTHLLQTFVLMGVYVGIIPVLLGLLWLPFLRGLGSKWRNFLLSLTVGLLVFLGFDALAEAFELISQVPKSYNGLGLLILGFFLAIFVLGATSKIASGMNKTGQGQAMRFAYLIAFAIGLHNLGEGLAIGSAYAIGEIALGSLLVIGFMIHNLTEGVAIVSPLTKTNGSNRSLATHLFFMGLIAGGPTIIGTIIGGFSYGAALSVFFLSLGAGAIFDVSYDIADSIAKKDWHTLFAFENVAGFLCGFAIIYLTGLLVIA